MALWKVGIKALGLSLVVTTSTIAQYILKGSLWDYDVPARYSAPKGRWSFRELLGGEVVCIEMLFHRGELWIGTYGHGLIRMNPRDGSYTRYTKNDGLPTDQVYALSVDAKGHIWVLNSEYDGRRWILHNLDGELPPYGWKKHFYTWEAIRSPDGSLWFGGYARDPEVSGINLPFGSYKKAGLFRYDGEHWTFYPVPGNSPAVPISVDYDGSIVVQVIADGYTFAKFDGERWTILSTASELEDEMGIADLRQGKWGGHSYIEVKELIAIFDNLFGISNEERAIFRDVSGLWISTSFSVDMEGTLYAFAFSKNGREWVIGRMDTSFIYLRKLPKSVIYDSQGNLWGEAEVSLAGNQSGVLNVRMCDGKFWYSFDGHNTGLYQRYPAFRAFYSPLKVAADDSGRVWLAAYGGVVEYDPYPRTAVENNLQAHLRFSLSQNYPNPFNTVTNIPFCLNASDYVRLEVYDLTGRKVRTLLEGKMDTGVHKVFWDGRDDDGSELASGVYLVRMDAGGFNKVRKVVLVR